ncbi:MAG: type II secretion system protein [Cyanobacteria bacterium SIG28]|nr:type II secretion system protein [Cyanobacteria bacterium SIG28]
MMGRLLMKQNKFYNIKPAFTLVELMIAMAIVGIILVFGMVTMKPKDDGLKYLYSNAYRSLSIAYYNGLINTDFNPFTFDADSYTETNDPGTEALCQLLTSYINSNNNNVGSGDYDTGCSDSKFITGNALDSEFNNINNAADFVDKVQFIANNGMKFYLSKKLEVSFERPQVIGEDEKDIITYPYYLVFVDVNGDTLPNSILYHGTQKPDIFAFAVFNTGYVIPLGIPEYDRTIMTASIAYFDNEFLLRYHPVPVAYFQAKGMAWGFYMPKQSNSSVKDVDYINLQDTKLVDIAEVHTLNDAVRASLGEDSNIVKGLNDFITNYPISGEIDEEKYEECLPDHETDYCVAMYTVGGLLPKPLLRGHCSLGDYEACFIVVDEYK